MLVVIRDIVCDNLVTLVRTWFKFSLVAVALDKLAHIALCWVLLVVPTLGAVRRVPLPVSRLSILGVPRMKIRLNTPPLIPCLVMRCNRIGLWYAPERVHKARMVGVHIFFVEASIFQGCYIVGE